MISFKNTHTKTGFTVVELLVVIVVLVLLAGIIALSYGGYQQKARDGERRSDVTQIAAALSNYKNWKNTYIEQGSGCGSSAAGPINGSGNGWLAAKSTDIATYATNSILDCLVTAKMLPDATVIDPSGCKWDSAASCGVAGSVPTKAYMKATCTKGGIKKTYIFAYLETQPSDNATIDNLCDTGTIVGFSGVSEDWGTRYGMNYYVLVP
jgi:prepilin-type N-terminal cleavage/methylation domain-containing protein